MSHTFDTMIMTDLATRYNIADDVDAATAGINVGNIYHTNGIVKIRLT